MKSQFRVSGALVVLFGCLLTGWFLPLPATAAGEKRPISLDLIYGKESLTGRLPGSLTWLPDGSGIVFVVTEGDGDEAEKTMFFQSAATGKKSIVLNPQEYEDLIGSGKYAVARPSGRAGASGFRLAPDGQTLLLAEKGDLFLIDLQEKKRTQITASAAAERHASFSPDGKLIAFVRDHNLFVMNLESRLEIQITRDGKENFTFGESDWVYDEELSVHVGYWWSPTSTHLAFLHIDESPVPEIPLVDFIPLHKKVKLQRYPKAGDPNPLVNLLVADVTGKKKPVAVDLPGLEERYIARVSFLSDGSKVMAQVLNRKQDTSRWMRCDLETGKSSLFLEERSRWWFNVHNDFQFLKDGRFLTLSERDGFNHIYLFGDDGSLIRQLTRGNWVVTSLAQVNEETETAYFVGTRKSILERHLYSVGFSGKSVTRITQDEGDHSVSISPKARFFVDTHSSVTSIARRDLREISGKKVETIAENSMEKIEELALGEVEFLTVPTEDGRKLPALFVKPHDFDPDHRYPVLFYIYGGPQSQVVRNRWGGSRYLWHQMLANQGILVFSIDNRASTGMGLASAGVIYERLCEVELSDFVEGARHISTLPYVDGSRLGIWGWSYGGTMAAYSILNAPETFKVAVSVAPVTDWRNYDSIYTERYMNTPQENPDGYDRTSVVGAAGNLTGHLLISHGTADDNVHFQNAVQLVKALNEEEKNYEFLMYPGGRHGIGGKKIQRQMFRAITSFLQEHMLFGGEPALPNGRPSMPVGGLKKVRVSGEAGGF